MAVMRLDLTRTWADARALLRANADAISALAGMFILLPGIVSSWLLPEPKVLAAGASLAAILRANMDYMAASWPIFLLSALVTAFGSLSLLSLLVHRSRPTVATAMRMGLAALPVYLLASMLQTLVMVGGMMLFVLPGLYLGARLICISVVAAAEERRTPFALLTRSFQITRGNGWRILLLLSVMLIVSLVVSEAAVAVFGIVSTLLLPADIARLIGIAVSSLVAAAFSVAVSLVCASIYRQAIAPPPPVPTIRWHGRG
ncbi:MAG: hypothetical protein ABW184_08755 [Sphingobium sp.]